MLSGEIFPPQNEWISKWLPGSSGIEYIFCDSRLRHGKFPSNQSNFSMLIADGGFDAE